MASTVTLKHYSDTNTTADTPVLSMDTSSATSRVIGCRHPKSIGWTSVFHSIEVIINADTDMIGVELLAIGMFIKDVRQDLM